MFMSHFLTKSRLVTFGYKKQIFLRNNYVIWIIQLHLSPSLCICSHLLMLFPQKCSLQNIFQYILTLSICGIKPSPRKSTKCVMLTWPGYSCEHFLVCEKRSIRMRNGSLSLAGLGLLQLSSSLNRQGSWVIFGQYSIHS